MAHEGHDHSHEHHHHEPASPAAQHRESAPASVACWVITCSDSRGPETDEGGPLARRALEHAGHQVLGSSVIRDDAHELRHALELAKDSGVRAVVVTGGTGLSSRDVTVETLRPMFARSIDGFGELFRALSFQQIGAAAMASRALAGVWEGIVVFALPGSPAAVKLAVDRLIVPELGHLVREVSR
ncbi:MAG: MogA/MoaB family molybdenum cofactor biosynthesis protein [Myxococcaceae bacterium]|nr:MogA/MoaB family molybdenum cofactor biosynthesis protein [Myxococcaceae bacterium]